MSKVDSIAKKLAKHYGVEESMDDINKSQEIMVSQLDESRLTKYREGVARYMASRGYGTKSSLSNYALGLQATMYREDREQIREELLKKLTVTQIPDWREIYWCGELNCPYFSTTLNLLNDACISVSFDGEYIGYEKKLEELERMFGKDSEYYTWTYELMTELASKSF